MISVPARTAVASRLPWLPVPSVKHSPLLVWRYLPPIAPRGGSHAVRTPSALAPGRPHGVEESPLLKRQREQLLEDLKKALQPYGLEEHAGKTLELRLGRIASSQPQERRSRTHEELQRSCRKSEWISTHPLRVTG